MNDDKPLPAQDVFDSAEHLMRRITAQLNTQLAQVRPPAERGHDGPGGGRVPYLPRS
jgi:hypothetical protein